MLFPFALWMQKNGEVGHSLCTQVGCWSCVQLLEPRVALPVTSSAWAQLPGSHCPEQQVKELGAPAGNQPQPRDMQC